MAGIFVIVLYLLVGLYVMRAVLYDHSPLIRAWIGLSFGLLLFLWLPALFAFFVKFTLLAQYCALATLVVIAAVTAFFERGHKARRRPLSDEDRAMLRALLLFALPMTLFMAFLQHTHTLREVGGGLNVGQSTYGDMAMHVSIITSLRGASLPSEYNILPGAILGYPILTDAMSTSMLLLGTPLRLSIILPGTVMSGIVFSGFLLLAREMTGKTSAAVLAAALLLFNGGLGFLYSFDMAASDPSEILEIFTGFYKTPPNQPDLNLRWSNIVVDMFLPQRTFLGGWVLLLPGLYFARAGFRSAEKRMFALAALFGAALPLVHTHSFLALALYSAGALCYALCARAHAPRRLLSGAALYGGVVLLLAVPQLLAFTFRQATESGFLRFHFNWVNNVDGLIDFYPWFWLKNIGLPLIIMLCALLNFQKDDRLDIVGASLIFIVAELVLFQPLDYDNNKLFYVWYALMLPMAADFAVSLYRRVQGARARVFLAALFVAGSTCSAALSMAREAVSDYQLFSETDVRVAEYIDQNTDTDAIFLTNLHHNNPVYTLAGRKVVCGPGNFLSTHGHYGEFVLRSGEINAFYRNPAAHLDTLSKYGVDYILLGPHELYDHYPDEDALDALFDIEFDDGTTRLYSAPDAD